MMLGFDISVYIYVHCFVLGLPSVKLVDTEDLFFF